MSTPETLTVNAYAKVNLTLEVLGRRTDGYHEIVSVMQTVDLHDVVKLTLADDVTLECDRPELETPDNLASRAAAALRAEAGVRDGVHVDLRKAIPTSAGLGGGSSDAARDTAWTEQVVEAWHVHRRSDPAGRRVGLRRAVLPSGWDPPWCMGEGSACALCRRPTWNGC